MRNWIAVLVAVLAIAACGGEEGELSHYRCVWDETTFIVCGEGEKAVSFRDACSDPEHPCKCSPASTPCSEEGVFYIDDFGDAEQG